MRERPARSPSGPDEAAVEVGLHYGLDDRPGITRRRRGRGWSYHDPQGRLIRSAAICTRLEALAVPPAWTDVWMSPDPLGHLQATGRDERGRKQYRYHSAWIEARSAEKFDRLTSFGNALPRIRRQIRRALARPDLDREKVLAAVIAVLEATAIRVGGEAYARENGTYGLATLRDRHVRIESNGVVHLRFEAKGGNAMEVSFRDRRLAKVIEACRALPGYEVFQWLAEDGTKHDVKSADVNDYIREISGSEFTSKDFRTWKGTLHAFRALADCPVPDDESEREARCLEAIDAAAEILRNTREVARTSYVHSGILDLFRQGELSLATQASGRNKPSGLSRDEHALLLALRRLQSR